MGGFYAWALLALPRYDSIEIAIGGKLTVCVIDLVFTSLISLYYTNSLTLIRSHMIVDTKLTL